MSEEERKKLMEKVEDENTELTNEEISEFIKECCDPVKETPKTESEGEKMKETKSRKGQIHRTWTQVLIDTIEEDKKKCPELDCSTTWEYVKFLQQIDLKVKETRKDKSFQLMVGRYKNLSEEEFKKQIERQMKAFKMSRVA